jgi:hypothetical protein
MPMERKLYPYLQKLWNNFRLSSSENYELPLKYINKRSIVACRPIAK